MRRLTVILAFLIVVFLVGIVGVPWLVRDQIQSNVSALIGQPVAIRDLELNPFSGTLLIQAVEIGERASIARIHVVAELLPLIDRRVVVKTLAVDGVILPVSISEGRVTIADYVLPDAGESSPDGGQPWSVVLEQVNLREWASAVVLDGVTYDVHLNTMELAGFTTARPDPVTFSLDLTANEARLDMEGEMIVSETATRIATQIELADLSLSDYRALAGTEIAGSVGFDGQLELSLGEPLTLAFDGTSVVAAFALGGIGLDRIAADQVDWQGRLDLSAADGKLSVLSVTGKTSIDELQLDPHARLGTLSLDGLNVGLTAFGADQIEITDVAVPPFGTIRTMAVNEAKFSAGSFSAATISVGGANLRVVRAMDGLIVGLPEPADEPDPDEPGIDISIASVVVVDSDLVFLDEASTPAVTLAITDTTLTMDNLSNPGPTTFELTAKHADQHDETDTVTASGTLALLSTPVTGNVTVDLSRFDLHKIDPYIGGGIRSGRLRLKSEINLAEELIEAQNDVEIVGIRVDKRAVDANVPSQEMPISLALSLLKDNDGRINLKVPVNSTRDEFTVDTGHIVQTALGNATRKAALNYAKFALQPFGSLLLAKDVADMLARPRFEPVHFGAAETSLSRKSSAYLGKLTVLLSERPELQITVCGLSTVKDLKALASGKDPVLTAEAESAQLALAEARGHMVRRSLVSAGVADERILSCAPDVLEDDSEPRVEISL